MKESVNFIFPHQLFAENQLLERSKDCYLIEEELFFKQYAFHKQKIAFHHGSMLYYADHLKKKKAKVTHIISTEKTSDVRVLIKKLAKSGLKKINSHNVTDNWLEKRMVKACAEVDVKIQWEETPLFINNKSELGSFFKPQKKKFYQTSFYKVQRISRNILVDNEDRPIGGKWSFDKENRKKYPKKKQPPSISFPSANQYHKAALKYVNTFYPDNPGTLDENSYYPLTHIESQSWLEQFFEYRFHEFGTYEDAIVAEHTILNHSVLTPMLNVGLLTPMSIINQALIYADKNDVPINSLEGFVRQIIGWREFIRGIYLTKGTQERTTNFWNFDKKIPESFYDGTTGIAPIDLTIKKVLETGYCHHIERLMVLGSFMVMCEFDPDEVYRWFMELFIDAYDWVMVPNVYGMSQYADGGLMSTKPYISGSNYLMKMSNYPKGDWQQTWDGLFWRFMHVHREFFLSNPRLGMLIGTWDKMSKEKKQGHLKAAKTYLEKLNVA